MAAQLLADCLKNGWSPLNVSKVQIAVGQYVAARLVPWPPVVLSQEDAQRDRAVAIVRIHRDGGGGGDRRQWFGLHVKFSLAATDRTLYAESDCARFLERVVVRRVK